MENITDYIEIMKESLSKKVQTLQKIVQANKEQWNVLYQEQFDEEKFQHSMDEKAECIEQLESLDVGFEGMYEKIASVLKENKSTYAQDIGVMQDYIRQITDLSVEIQAQETRNQKAFLSKTAQMRKEIHRVKTTNQVATGYYNNMNKLGALEPQFLDQKK